jgi:phosphatidylserine decarboxylase
MLALSRIDMAKEGFPFIIFFALPAIAAAIVGVLTGFGLAWAIAALCAALALFMVYFFRDPERVAPDETAIVVSPADGKVMVVEKVDPADAASPTQISIFLSPVDVHIKRSPIAGTIEEVVYKPGEFRVASRRVASEVNEQNVITIANEDMRIVTRQIAGLLARRIVFWKKAGDRVELGERFGLMKFSSRMDVVVPAEVEVLCAVGDRVVGGVTIIGRKRA